MKPMRQEERKNTQNEKKQNVFLDNFHNLFWGARR